jgi:hypothetical protein
MCFSEEGVVKMKPISITCCGFACLLLCFCLFPFADGSLQAQNVNQGLDIVRTGTYDLSNVLRSSSSLREDSADIAVSSLVSYPGRFTELEVLLKNPMPIVGFQLMVTISNPDLINFHTESVVVDTCLVLVDTCSGPQPHDSACFVDSSFPAPVRHCYIDTASSLIGNFEIVECIGDTGDTSLPDCKWIQVLGMAQLVGDSMFIPPDTSYRTLFKFGVDLLCLSDTVGDRSVSFHMFCGETSFLADPRGDVVSFRYHQGELTVLRSVPGDASNDGVTNVSDIVFLISYFFRDGLGPCVMEAADPNADCRVDPADLVCLVNFLFREGPPPAPGCAH